MTAGRSVQLARLFARAAQLDREWQGKVTQDEADKALYTPWMPFQVYQFMALVPEAMAWFADEQGRQDITALEIGCGPGSKLLLMRDHFSLDAHGIDREPQYVAAARSLGLSAEVADAERYAGYGRFDLIWFNRVARDPAIQLAIEHAVWAGMRPGAVVICANLEYPPPQAWIPVLDDWELRRGIWVKPPGEVAW